MDRPGLELNGITKRYGDLVAVRDLSLEVQPGEVFELMEAWRGRA